MSTRRTSRASRAQVWMESLGEWSWPGVRAEAAVEALPPAWVPAFPPRLEPATAGAALPDARRSGRVRAHRLITGTLLCAIAAVCATLALHGRLTVEHLIGIRTAESTTQQSATAIDEDASQPPLTLKAVSEDAAGSSIETASYTSAALNGTGSLLTYLPPGYASTTSHYPVLYMLTGNDQSNEAFLQIGLQGALDRLIDQHKIAPLIAVMIQGGSGSNNWRNQGQTRYESYVLEVQQLIDRTLPTVARRGARAIVGDSMGGYGAMNVALANPYRFGTVESWLSFFNGLSGDLHADRPIFKQLGLHAFVYGGEEDRIANPEEDAPFAAALRSAGADAKSAVYPGEHNLETLEAHLSSMLRFAGRSLSQPH